MMDKLPMLLTLFSSSINHNYYPSHQTFRTELCPLSDPFRAVSAFGGTNAATGEECGCDHR